MMATQHGHLRPSFWEGAARIFDFRNILNRSRPLPPAEADYRALASDWLAVSQDLRGQMDAFAATHVNELAKVFNDPRAIMLQWLAHELFATLPAPTLRRDRVELDNAYAKFTVRLRLRGIPKLPTFEDYIYMVDFATRLAEVLPDLEEGDQTDSSTSFPTAASHRKFA